MGCGVKIVSNNLLNEVVFVSITQENQTINLGEKTIPFNVLVIPGSSSISGTYNIYSPKYKTNYSLIVPNSINTIPCITPTPTKTPSMTPTPTISITQTPTISITQTPSMTPTPTISITQTPSMTPTPTITLTPTISLTPTPTITPTNATFCNSLIDYNGPEIYPYNLSINIGSTTGTTLTFEYSAYTVADRFILYYENNILNDTGYVGSFVYDYNEMYRENFTEHLTGKIDPITGLEYPNINSTNAAPDGYPFVNPINKGVFTYIKNSPTQIAQVEVYSCAPLNIWTFRLNCPN